MVAKGYLQTSPTGPLALIADETTDESNVATEASLLPRRVRIVLGVALIGLIAALDFSVRRTNFSILYVAPLAILAWNAAPKAINRLSLLLGGLTFGVFFLKNLTDSAESELPLFDYRIINRGMVAIMIVLMGRLLAMWSRWRQEQSDAELPTLFRDQDQDISETLAVLCCVPLLLLIAVVDYRAPADINLSILYPLPFFMCAWTNSRRLLWGLFALLVLSTFTLSWMGPPPTMPEFAHRVVWNRAVTATAMLCVAIVLHLWMTRNQQRWHRVAD